MNIFINILLNIFLLLEAENGILKPEEFYNLI